MGKIEQEQTLESILDGSAEFQMARNPFGYQPWRDKRSFAVSLLPPSSKILTLTLTGHVRHPRSRHRGVSRDQDPAEGPFR